MSKSLLIPRQPFMTMLADTYYKKIVSRYGISHFYTCVVEEGVTEISTSLPDCCVDLMFYWDKSRSHFGANIVGSTLFPHEIEVKEGYEYFGIRFMPGEMPSMLNLLLGEVLEQNMPLQYFIDEPDLIERIAVAEGFHQRMQIFLEYYLPRYYRQEKLCGKTELNQYILFKIMSSQGNLKIASLAEESGYSKRYVSRAFSEMNRISPKQFCEIIRFQTMVQKIECQQNMKLFYELGFYDQSHFCNDFKKFSGRSPMEFVEELKQEKFDERLKVIE